MRYEMQGHDAYNPPDLIDVVSYGLSRLLARNLDFSPSPEDLPITAEVMTEDLVRAGKTNHIQIQDALEYVGRTERKWPQPAVVIQTIKDMSRNRVQPQLPAPEITDEKISENRRKLKQLIGGLKKYSEARQQKEKSRKLEQPTKKETFLLTPNEEEKSREAFINGGISAQRDYLYSIGKSEA